MPLSIPHRPMSSAANDGQRCHRRVARNSLVVAMLTLWHVGARPLIGCEKWLAGAYARMGFREMILAEHDITNRSGNMTMHGSFGRTRATAKCSGPCAIGLLPQLQVKRCRLVVRRQNI
jgi:hypothetical protein